MRKVIERENILKDWLTNEASEFRKRADRSASLSTQLQSRLLRLAGQIQGEVRLIDHYRRQRWRFPVAFGGLPLHYKKEISTGDRPPEVHSIPLQERELDSRFQIRLGTTFRVFLRKEDGISLRTVARLVVLFLYVAGLAEEDGNGVKLRHSGLSVSVSTVVQKLRRARVP